MSQQYAIGEVVEITISRQESNFDRACDTAYGEALMHFGCDDGGHLANVKGSERSTDSVVVRFEAYRRTDHNSEYFFMAWTERCESR